jgi:hypothetical protein
VISDDSLKVLFGLLNGNKNLEMIHYTVTEKHNIDRKASFLQDRREKRMTLTELTDKYLHDHHHELKCWQKAILPYWLFKTVVHYEHEAFRFKYNPNYSKMMEEDLMGPLSKWLYFNFVLYLVATVGGPMYFGRAATCIDPAC